jgi:hypothetical protein
MSYPRWYRNLFAVLLIVAGGLFLIWAMGSILLGLSAFAWPTAEASIAQNQVETFKRPRGGIIYCNQVSYEYSVDATTYTGSRVQFGLLGSNFQTLTHAISEEVLRHSRQSIRYLPLYPSLSTMKPGFSLLALVPLMAGTVFVVLAYSIHNEA